MKTISILFVDDDADDKEIFFEAIHAINPEIEYVTATNGEEALAILEGSVTLPHYIFLDINMPVMNGKAFLERIKGKENLSRIPVIIYSTTEDREEIKTLCSMGAEYIGKPTSFEKLKNLLSKYVGSPAA